MKNNDTIPCKPMTTDDKLDMLLTGVEHLQQVCGNILLRLEGVELKQKDLNRIIGHVIVQVDDLPCKKHADVVRICKNNKKA